MRNYCTTLLVFVLSTFFAVGESEGRDIFVSPMGNNTDGSSPASAYNTIEKGAAIASSGDVVHIMPGVYRESVRLPKSGQPDERIHFKGEGERGAAKMFGSVNSSQLAWRPLQAGELPIDDRIAVNIWCAELSGWEDAPLGL